MHLSYLPLAHIYERLCVWGIFALGGKIGFFNGDIRLLNDDLETLKPTFLVSVPRLYNKFAELIRRKIEKNNSWGITKRLTNQAISYKLRKLKEKGQLTSYSDYFLQTSMRPFGGNIKFLVTASAPISP